MLHVRKNDQVMVVSGKEKGKQGKVLRILAGSGRVVVEKLNMVKKHTRPGQGNRTGGIVEKEASIALSSVLPICPKEDRPRRVRAKFVGEKDDRKKIRVCAKCGEKFPS